METITGWSNRCCRATSSTSRGSNTRRWRLSPAFDIVPNPELVPTTLSMQLSLGRFDIARDAVLADAVRFGFTDCAAAATRLDALTTRAGNTLPDIQAALPPDLAALLQERFDAARARLQA